MQKAKVSYCELAKLIIINYSTNQSDTKAVVSYNVFTPKYIPLAEVLNFCFSANHEDFISHSAPVSFEIDGACHSWSPYC